MGNKICACCGTQKTKIWFQYGLDCTPCRRVINRVRKENPALSLEEARAFVSESKASGAEAKILSEDKLSGMVEYASSFKADYRDLSKTVEPFCPAKEADRLKAVKAQNAANLKEASKALHDQMQAELDERFKRPRKSGTVSTGVYYDSDRKSFRVTYGRKHVGYFLCRDYAISMYERAKKQATLERAEKSIERQIASKKRKIEKLKLEIKELEDGNA